LPAFSRLKKNLLNFALFDKTIFTEVATLFGDFQISSLTFFKKHAFHIVNWQKYCYWIDKHISESASSIPEFNIAFFNYQEA